MDDNGWKWTMMDNHWMTMDNNLQLNFMDDNGHGRLTIVDFSCQPPMTMRKFVGHWRPGEACIPVRLTSCFIQPSGKMPRDRWLPRLGPVLKREKNRWGWWGVCLERCWIPAPKVPKGRAEFIDINKKLPKWSKMTQNDPKWSKNSSNLPSKTHHYVETRPVSQGLPASPGAAMGKVVFCADEAGSFRNKDVRSERNRRPPETF